MYASSLVVNPDRGKPLSFEGYEYLNQPMRDTARRIVIQKAAQVGATVMAILRAVWFIDTHGASTMYLVPTHRSALRFSRGRFQVLLEHSPYLRGLFQAVKSGHHLRAGAANFYCHGARSRADLMSTPVQYLTLDERDELYLGKVASPQPWSAVELARQRLSGQRDYWELDLSTPTIPGHGIAAEFAKSDQHFYQLCCPLCDEYATPTWPDAVGQESGVRDQESGIGSQMPCADGDLDLTPDSCLLTPPFFRCVLCRQPWTEDERRQAIRAGRWVAAYPGRGVRGYHLSQLIAPNATAERLVRQWQASRENPQARQVFYNSMLGLPYVAEGARLEERFIRDAVARGGYPMAATSQGSTMGVDVGPTWFHVVVAEPLPAVPPCDGGTTGGFLRLVWAGKVHEWQQLPELIARYNVLAYVIDAMPETHQARALVRSFPQGYLCYYGGPKSGPALDSGSQVLRAPRTESLDAMYLRWRTGKLLAPSDLPAEFADHLQALVRVLRVGRDGQAVADYLEAGGPDHFAHALNYCELSLLLRGQPLRFQVTSPPPGGIAW